MESFKGVSLHIPVYCGKELFVGALQSIEEASIEFENIFISFNGFDSTDYDRFTSLQKQGLLKRDYKIFRTHQDLTAAEHGFFVLRKIKKHMLPSSLLMLLAHDDRIMQPKSRDAQRDFFATLRSDTVYFPTYHCCIAGDYENVTHVVGQEKNYTTQDFFNLTMRKNVRTNMSGMIMPFSAYESAVETITKIATGARAEHLFCMGPSVRHVQFTKAICALVGERENSDGKTLSLLEHRRAALSYVLSYAKNGHLGRAGGYTFFGYELAKKTTALFIAKIKDKIPHLS